MKTKAIVFIAVGLAAIIAMHVILFRPLASEYKEVVERTSRDLPIYRKIIGQYDPDRVVRITRQMQDDVQRQVDEYGRLQQRYQLDTKTFDFRGFEERLNKVITDVEEMVRKERETEGTVIRVSQGWGIAEGFVPARFGKGLDAYADNYAVMPGEERTFHRERGTIECWVSPKWNALEDDKVRYIFMAHGRLEPEGGGRAQVAHISLFKDERGSLVYELQQGNGRRSRIAEDITYWRPNQWHHVAVTWDKANPDDVALFVNNRRSLGIGRRGDTGAARGMMDPAMGMMDPAMGMMGMPGMGMMGMPGATRRRPQEVVGFAPEIIDEIIVGADRFYLNAADAIIDEFRISNIPRKSFNLNAAPERDANTLVLDHMEDYFFDDNLLEYVMQQMESKVRLISDPFIAPQLKNEKQTQYDALRKTLSLDEERLSQYNQTSAWIQRIYFVDQISRRLEGYRRDKVQSILNINWPGFEELDSLISFLDLTHEIVDKGIGQNLDTIDRVDILGEATYVDEEDLKKFFDKEIENLMMKSGMGMMGMMGMDPSMMGMMGMGMGMPGMGMMDPAMMGMGMGMDPAMMGMGMGMDPAMMGMGMGMGQQTGGRIGSATDMEAMMEKQKEMERNRKKFEEWQEAKDRGIIPQEVRRDFQDSLGDEGFGFYKRRSVRVSIECNIDKLSEFLFTLEFGERVSTVNTMSIESGIGGQKDTLTANITYDVHTMDPLPESVSIASAEG